MSLILNSMMIDGITMGYNRLQQVKSPILTSSNGGHLINTPSTITTPTSTKGLLNGPGQNNCFLNCAVQVCLFLFIHIHIYYQYYLYFLNICNY